MALIHGDGQYAPEKLPDTFAVDVHGEDVVAHLRQHAGTFLLIVAQPRPLVDDQHGGALALEGVVID